MNGGEIARFRAARRTAGGEARIRRSSPSPSGRSSLLTSRLRAAFAAIVLVAGMLGAAPPVQAATPLNDDLSAALRITGESGTQLASNVGATAEDGEPNHGSAGDETQASIWFAWTAPETGVWRFDTIGSGVLDTQLAVYTGDAFPLTFVAENDDIDLGGGDWQSRITFSAIGGVTYKIAVDGYAGETGEITLNWQRPTVVFPPGGLVVTTEDDHDDGTCDPVDCSLREAVVTARFHAGRDTITVPAGTYGLCGFYSRDDDDDPATTDLDLDGELVIRGEGARATTIGGCDNNRIFDILPGADVEILDVLIHQGMTDGGGGGGAIRNAGTLLLENVGVERNAAEGQGGGLENTGTAVVRRSAFVDNFARDGGGGISNTGDLTLADSTLSDNSSSFGPGGGLYAGSIATTTIASSTIAYNRGDGGGIYQDPAGTLNLGGSIISNNWSPATPTEDDCNPGNSIASLGHNIDGDGRCRLGQPTDQPATDPRLDLLGDNGGPTDTHAIGSTSPALDAGPTAGPACGGTDQRGTDRPQGSACDIGAYEAEQGVVDSDGDGYPDTIDTCPSLANADQTDTDLDGLGDACDPDDDNDGLLDENDPFPLDPTESADTDSDGVGDSRDNCPLVGNPEQTDTDLDGLGDACDADDDNDGVPDGSDPFPLDPTESVDTDGDGVGNRADPDDDNDGTPDADDNCPLTFNPTQADFDRDGSGNECDLFYGSTLTAGAGGASDDAAAGETVSSLPAHPFQVSVTTPNPGPVSISTLSFHPTSRALGFVISFFHIEAPRATRENPLTFTLRLDASLFLEDEVGRIRVVLDSTVGACTAADIAAPDPCLSDVRVLDDGDLQFTVLSSHASRWQIELGPPNAAPVADDTEISVPHRGQAAFRLPATDPDGDPLTFELDGPSGGATLGDVVITGDEVSYSPTQEASGQTDTFRFRAVDAEGAPSNWATVTVHITNTAPIAEDVPATVSHRTPVEIQLNASDAEFDSLTYEVQLAPQHGTVSIDGDRATYTPTRDVVGIDTFTYTAFDGGIASAPATVTVELTNQAPTASVDLEPGSPLPAGTLAATATGSDADGDDLAYTFHWWIGSDEVQVTPSSVPTDVLDLAALGAAPGDEVRVRVEVSDGHETTGAEDGVTVADPPRVSPRALKQQVIELLQPFLGTADKWTDDRLRKALEHVARALEGDLWRNDDELSAKGKKTFHEDRSAIHELLRVLTRPREVAADLRAAIENAIGRRDDGRGLLHADSVLANDAIEKAVAKAAQVNCMADSADPRCRKLWQELDKAHAALADAGAAWDASDAERAATEFGEAWSHATKAYDHGLELAMAR